LNSNNIKIFIIGVIMANNTAYSFQQGPLAALAPYPKKAKRVPTTADKLYPVGQLWVNELTNIAYILTSVVNNSATWQTVSTASSPFNAITVTTGPNDIEGTTTINTTSNASTSIGNTNSSSGIALLVGTGNFSLDGVASSTYTIGAATTTGTVTIGGTAQTGNFVLAPSTGAGTITLGNANGAKTINIGNGISGNTISVGNGANSSAQVINISAGASAADSTVNILSGNGSAGTQTANILTGTRAGAVNIGTGAAAHTITIGNATASNITNLASPITALPGPVYIYTGAGAPGNGLAVNVGDLYINTTAASAVTRMYIATAVGTWTNITAAA
jgi:hypothetical protein